METQEGLIYNLSAPLNGATTAVVDIDTGDGNLTVDSLTGGEQLLAGGTLQYLEKQGVPQYAVSLDNGQARLTLRAGEAARSWFHLPWDAANGATEWQVHLNPNVQSDITAHSDGGNVKLDLARIPVHHLMADTGGGNMDVVLPDNAANLSAAARTGAGNVTVEVGSGLTGTNTLKAQSGAGNVVVRMPSGIAARIHATSGMGKVIVESRFGQVDKDTYQSLDYNAAATRIDVTLKSGAGNVSVEMK